MADVHFFLMHKDDIVTAIVIDVISGAILKISPNGNPDLLPLGGRQSADTSRKCSGWFNPMCVFHPKRVSKEN